MPPQAPAEHLQTCRDLLMPLNTCHKYIKNGTLSCTTDTYARRNCARSCNTCTRLMAPIQVGMLVDGVLPIPDNNITSVILEIGSSDRNTMDMEVLNKLPNTFLVTAEPLVEKYARALGRRRDSNTVRDALEPLGQHHDRGFVLPFAVAPIEVTSGLASLVRHSRFGEDAVGELRELNVGGNSGCASLRMPNRNRHRGGGSFGVWCDQTGDSPNAKIDSRSGSRSVWTVPLSQLLKWIGRPVDFVKIDAQGMDLEIVTSGGDMLRNVRRVQMEVISDDCKAIYENQPQCSEVISRMQSLGFEPLSPIPCKPNFTRHRVNHYCELEYVFINTRMGVTAADTPAVWSQYHNGHMNWCTSLYDTIASPHPSYFSAFMHHNSLPNGTMVAATRYDPNRAFMLGPRFYRLESFSERSVLQYALGRDEKLGKRAVGLDNSEGQSYMCPDNCAAPSDGSKPNRTHFRDTPIRELHIKHKLCPFS